MKPYEFDYNRFQKFREEKENFFRRFSAGEYKGPVLTQQYCGQAFASSSLNKETCLEAWLDNLTVNMQLHGDVAYTYLEPWAGVPVYANAFGANLYYNGVEAAQSTPRYTDVSEVENVPMPKPGDCELMRTVMEYIRYFKEQTHGELPICLTDCQSPCDTASLILDPCELFAASLEDPDSLTDFMEKVTRCIAEFTEMQADAIGPELLAGPGHSMVSATGMSGISVSDDNMAVISPASFAVIADPWNRKLADHFGGIAVHSCGIVTPTLPAMFGMTGFSQFDCKVTDFEPNDPKRLAELFAGRETILKVDIHPDEDPARLIPLLRSDIKLILQLFVVADVEEQNRKFDKVAQFVHEHYRVVN